MLKVTAGAVVNLPRDSVGDSPTSFAAHRQTAGLAAVPGGDRMVLACATGVWNLTGMDTAVVAIHGHGLLPGLLAIKLLNQDHTLPVLLLSRDLTIGGEHLEPVVASRLSAAAQALVDPFVVSSWPGYYLVRDGVHELQEDAVLLLDPVQVWLELQTRLVPAALVAPCGKISLVDNLLSWAGGNTAIDRLIDLEPLLGPCSESEIVGIAEAHSLTLPVLADYDCADGQWSAHQYLPLGDERLVVRKLPRADHLIGQHSNFETLLNALIAA